jgi:serine/threonine protein kinase
MTLRYRLGAKIGSGGAAEVFRARLDDGALVAVKRIHADRVAGPRQAQRLMLEAEVTAALEHPHIVRLHGLQRDEQERLCLVLELVEGVDLARLMRGSRVPLSATVYIVGALLRALDHAHEHGRVVHRDVSPHNVLLGWDGTVKLSDFGLARDIGRGPTTGGLVRGKVSYLSPEQAQRAVLDGRSDLFSVGVILYELLTGRLPHGGTEGEIVAQLLGQEPFIEPRTLCPELPAALSELTMKLLERERSKRFQSAREALAALPDTALGRAELVALLRELRPTGALDDSVSPSATSARPRRRRGAAVLVASLVLAGGAALGLGLWRFAGPPPVHVHAVPRAADTPVPVVLDRTEVRDPDRDEAGEVATKPAPTPRPHPSPSSEEIAAPRHPTSPAVQSRKRASSRAVHLAPRAEIVPAPEGSGHIVPRAEIVPIPEGSGHIVPRAEIPETAPGRPGPVPERDTHAIWEEIVPADPDRPSPIWQEIEGKE